MAEFGDDECIAIAMLHGCEFHDCEGRWYVDSHEFDGPEKLHPVEAENYSKWKRAGAHGYWGWPSRAAVARDYCRYYNLLR